MTLKCSRLLMEEHGITHIFPGGTFYAIQTETLVTARFFTIKAPAYPFPKLVLQSSPTSTLAIVDGGWGEWTSWTECSRTCGSGFESRLRLCDSPEPAHLGVDCTGDAAENRPCFYRECPGKHVELQNALGTLCQTHFVAASCLKCAPN